VKKTWVTAVVALMAGFAILSAQTSDGTPFRIEKLDPVLDEIIAPNAAIETLGDRFALTEGPVWVDEGKDGYLLFSDCAANVIYKWVRNKPLSVFLEKSGFTGNDPSHAGAQTVAGRLAILLIGSNGLALDPEGRLIVTAMTDRTVYRLEKDGTRTILADRFEGKRFNGPNDVVVKSDGSIYFTDTPWGMRDADKSASRELPFNGFYLIKEWQDHAARRRQRRPRRDTKRHYALTRRTVALYNGWSRTNHAVRHYARRYRGKRPPFRGSRHRRPARRPKGKSVLLERRHSWRYSDHVTSREADRQTSSAATGGRAPPSRLCDEHGLRRRRQPRSLHYRVHALV